MDVRNEPSMEEILASIKRIIAEDGTAPTATRSRQPRPALMAGKAGSAAIVPDAGAQLADAPRDEAAEPDALELDTPAPEEPEPDMDEEAEVLELTQAMPLGAELAAPHEEEAEVQASPLEKSDEAARERPGAPIVSDNAATASRQALAALSAMIVKPGEGVDNSLDGLVREMLRPMLKEWLDAKLPDLVQAMVAKEIERIAGRGL